MQAVILCGGMGTRLGASVPKCLVPVHGRPLLDRLLERLYLCGFTEAVLCTGHRSAEVWAFVSEAGWSSPWPDVRFVDDGPVPLGTAGALLRARDVGALRKTFLVTYGDALLPYDYAEPMRALRHMPDRDVVAAVYSADPGNVPGAYGQNDYGAIAVRRRVLDYRDPWPDYEVRDMLLGVDPELVTAVLPPQHIGTPADLARLEAHIANPVPGIILDRDGTLIEPVGNRSAFFPSEVRLLPGVVDALRRAQSAGYVLAIATNQPGPDKGQCWEYDVWRTNRALVDTLSRDGIHIATVQACMHAADRHCACRKPAPGMLHKIVSLLNLDASRSYMLGDRVTDAEAAAAAGLGYRPAAGGLGAAIDHIVGGS